MKISRASVIAEPLPRAKYLVFGSAGQAGEIGKSAQPLLIIGNDRGDLRLLEHELGDENCVRIAGPAPGEIAPVISIPTQQPTTKNGKVLWRSHALKANVQRPTLNVQRRIQS